MQAPKNKHESTDYFARGLYGNSIRQWTTWEEAADDTDYQGTHVIRYKGENGAQGPAIFDVPRYRLLKEWTKLLRTGWKEERLYVNEAVPKDRIIFQGELSTGNWHHPEWRLVGHAGPGIHMRDAMKLSDFQREGWQAKEYLRKHMDWSSWGDLMQLLDQWQEPDKEAVIELVILDTPVGRLAHTGRRTIFWEFRNQF